MPWDARYRKPDVHGITANAIEVVVEAGDCGPVTPIGINLPNDQAIREQYGSKSVSLANVIEASDKATPTAFRREFSWTPEEADRATKWSTLGSELLVNMHEVIGHASGKIAESLKGQAAGLRSRSNTRRSRKAAPTSSRSISCPTPSLPNSDWLTRPTRPEVAQGGL